MGKLRDWLVEKLNPAQADIYDSEGEEKWSTNNRITTTLLAYEKIPVVSRGINLIVDSSSSISIDIGNKIRNISPNSSSSPRAGKLNTLLNFSPNPYMSANTFKSNVFMDLLIDGNAFIYFDGAFLYNIPAADMVIKTDKINFISGYEYNNTKFKPDEIIHIRENTARSLYRGESRVIAAISSINVLDSMNSYQKNFFDNNAIPGIVLSTPNIMSKKIKDRIIQNWIREYSPTRGGRRPMILDGEFKINSLGDSTFKELDFSESITVHEGKILKALGVPPVLLDSGNNANLSPNLRLFYISTILPLFRKYVTSLELFFGYDLKENTQDIEALRPELADQANYLTSLANAGVITRNEARTEIRKPPSDEEFADQLILPANIAGSALNSGVGGRPEENDED